MLTIAHAVKTTSHQNLTSDGDAGCLIVLTLRKNQKVRFQTRKVRFIIRFYLLGLLYYLIISIMLCCYQHLESRSMRAFVRTHVCSRMCLSWGILLWMKSKSWSWKIYTYNMYNNPSMIFQFIPIHCRYWYKQPIDRYIYTYIYISQYHLVI